MESNDGFDGGNLRVKKGAVPGIGSFFVLVLSHPDHYRATKIIWTRRCVKLRGVTVSGKTVYRSIGAY